MHAPSSGAVYINGVAYWRDAQLWVPAGTDVAVEAKANPGYVFLGWEDGFSDPRSPVQTFRMDAPRSLKPAFKRAHEVTIASSPPGLQVLVDGGPVKAPAVFNWGAGSQHLLAPVSQQAAGDGQYWFLASWSNGAPEQQIYTVPGVQGEQTITANYVRGGVVTVLAEPFALKVKVDGSDAWPSPNFVWGPDSVHELAAQPEQTDKSGRRYIFRGWSDGSAEATRLFTVNGAALLQGIMLVAHYEPLDQEPDDGSTRIVNAAGATPEPGVAAGSIISIYGENLAPEVQVGPLNPLAQTLAGVTVALGSDRLLPLLFVSEGQINALLPSDLEPGEYRLTVRCSGRPDVSAGFRAVRNAPGLFANWIDSVAYASAIHSDGTPVLPGSPASPGEEVTLLGTGFGPYLPSPLDGFAVPPGGVFPLTDPVEVLLDDLPISPLWVRAAEGLVGTAAVRIQVPDGLIHFGAVRLRVRINNRESNLVNLPLAY